MKKKLILYGLRTSILDVVAVAEYNGYEIIGAIDNEYHLGWKQSGIEIIGTLDDLMSRESNRITDMKDSVEFFPGSFMISKAGEKWFEKRVSSHAIIDAANVKVATLVGRNVNDLDKFNVKMGKGVFVDDNARIAENAVIDDYVTISWSTYVGHGAHMKRQSGTGTNVFVGDNVIVGERTMLFSNSVIGSQMSKTSNLTIGDRCVIGLGMTVMTDVPDDTIIVPADNAIRKVHNKFTYAGPNSLIIEDNT